MEKKSRIADQLGQWKNTTPKSVKKKQQKAWDKLEKSLGKKKKK